MAPKAAGVKKTAGKKKSTKIPGIKKPSGAYIHFCNDKRAAIKIAHPSWGIGEIGKELGAQWKKVTDAEKVKYNAAAEKDKARYQKELAAYNKSG